MFLAGDPSRFQNNRSFQKRGDYARRKKCSRPFEYQIHMAFYRLGRHIHRTDMYKQKAAYFHRKLEFIILNAFSLIRIMLFYHHQVIALLFLLHNDEQTLYLYKHYC